MGRKPNLQTHASKKHAWTPTCRNHIHRLDTRRTTNELRPPTEADVGENETTAASPSLSGAKTTASNIDTGAHSKRRLTTGLSRDHLQSLQIHHLLPLGFLRRRASPRLNGISS
ncbi:hypothetical protein Rs2_37978 [Raphanus sativus]|nr:hypothetical protein Rs2_37978 [Raphanus sativus]